MKRAAIAGYIGVALLLISAAIPQTARAALYIGGTPPTTVAAPGTYSFTPTVSTSANSSRLRFAISGKPDWAQFNYSDGTLSGAVGTANIGTYRNIKISVSSWRKTTSLATFAINVVAASTSTTSPPPPAPTAGTLLLSSSSYTVVQNAGQMTVQVNRTTSSSGAVSASFATVNGTAVAGTDYTAVSGTLQWASGDTTAKSFSVPVSNAVPFTGSKAFSVALSNPSSGATIGTPGSASVTITGSGAPPASGSGSAPSAVSNLQLINQGGASNATTPLSNIQQISWSAATAAANPVSYYKIYRNGTAYATTTGLTYTDTNATASNDPNWATAATVYSYNVTAVDTQGNEGPKAAQMSAYAYRNGISTWSNNDLSYGTLVENYSSTAGNPTGGTYDVSVDFINGGFQPAVHPGQAPLWNLEIGAFNYFTIDINPGPVVYGNKLMFGTVSRVPPGDVYGWHPSINVFDYGPAPVANTWATYKVPLIDVAMGACQFTGSISGNTLTVTAIVSGKPLVDAGGFVTGPGVPSGTYISAYAQNGAIGKFTLAGPGISANTQVASTTLTYQRTSLYKFGLQPNIQGMTIYLNNMGFTAN